MIHYGYLLKLSPARFLGRTRWQRRFCVLTSENKMLYAKSPEALLGYVSGVIPMERVTVLHYFPSKSLMLSLTSAQNP